MADRDLELVELLLLDVDSQPCGSDHSAFTALQGSDVIC